MKKESLLKILGIIFAITVVLSWIIPAGSLGTGSLTSYEETISVGIFDITRMPFLSIATFIQYGLLFIAIGIFYGVLGKTGAYTSLIDSLGKKVKKNKFLLMIVAISFIVLSALTALPNVLFILVPFFVTLLLKSGYSKLETFSATVGAILVGQIGNVLGFNIWGYFVYFFQVDMFAEMLIRIIILLVVAVLFILMLRGNKTVKGTKKETVEIPLYSEVKTKKSVLPALVISLVGVVVLILGLFNWSIVFETTVFTDLHQSIMDFKIGEYALFANILGSVGELGSWGNYELIVILVLASLLIGWLYSLKFKDIFEGMLDGAKKMLPAAIYSMIASVVFAVILTMQVDGQPINFVNTIIGEVIGTGTPNVFSTVFSSAIGSVFYNDFYTLISSVGAIYLSSESLEILLIIFQVVNGLVMLIAPVSIYLIAGLKFMNIEYLTWVKYIWKYVLMILAFIIVIGLIIMVV